MTISRDFLPIVKEYRAAQRAINSPGGVMTTLEIRTVITGLLALAVTVATPVLLIDHINIPSGWWGAFASIWTFYFVDPKTIIASTMENIRRETTVTPQEDGR